MPRIECRKLYIFKKMVPRDAAECAIIQGGRRREEVGDNQASGAEDRNWHFQDSSTRLYLHTYCLPILSRNKGINMARSLNRRIQYNTASQMFSAFNITSHLGQVPSPHTPTPQHPLPHPVPKTATQQQTSSSPSPSLPPPPTRSATPPTPPSSALHPYTET